MLQRRSQRAGRPSDGAFLEGGGSSGGRGAPVTLDAFGRSFGGGMDSGRSAGLTQRGGRSRKAAPEQDDMMANAVLGKKD